MRSSFSSSKILLLLGMLAIASLAYAFDASHLAGMDAGPLLLGIGAVAPAAGRPFVAFGRMSEPMKPFYNVAASTIASSTIPRYPRTILNILLQLGGTTLAKSDISRIELFLGEKSIWGPVSGTELNDVVNYEGGWRDQDANMLPLDFTLRNIKEIGGEQIGGIDLTTLPDGVLRMEVELGSGASAPTLSGHITWGAPQGGGDIGGLMLKLIKRTYPQMASGDQYPAVDLNGAIIARQFIRYTVATAAVSTAAGQAASFANTGNGVMGAITVSQGTPRGRYRLKVLEPAANAGAFMVTDPNGREIGSGNVAAAFSGGGLAFTLADGATDFSAGDGFTIDVLPFNTDGNLNYVEVKKNEQVWWGRSDRAAAYEQQRWGRTPQSKIYVVDFVKDNHSDSMLDTADASSLDYRVTLTSADTLTMIHQVLARPIA